MKNTSKKRRSLAWLRRAEIGALTRGLAWGLLLPAPCAFAVYIFASRAAPPFVFAPPRPWPEVDSAASTAELSFALAPFLRGEATLIVGSSEMTRGQDAAPDRARSATERLNACSAGAPLQSVAPAGHAARRAARLLQRLRGHFTPARPARLIVIDNSHYATRAAQTIIEDRDYFLEPTDYAHYRLLETADADNRGAGQPAGFAGGVAHFFQLRSLEFRSFRAFLGRRLVGPQKAALISRARGETGPHRLTVAGSAAPEPDRAFLRSRKAFQEDLENAPYGRALLELRRAADTGLPPGSQWRVLLLPPNQDYYVRLGFSSQDRHTMSQDRERTLVKLLGPQLVATPELAPSAVFVDAAHYNASGRQLLADAICRVASRMRAE